MKNTIAVLLAALTLVTVSQSAFAGRYKQKVSCTKRACTTANRKSGCCQDLRDKKGVCYKVVDTTKCSE